MFAKIPLEAVLWVMVLLWLGISEPPFGQDFTLCPLNNLGITNCPGCGLGRSISYALHGRLGESLHAHVLGIPAIVVLMLRSISLLKNTFQKSTGSVSTNQRKSHGQRNAVDADA